MKTARQCALEVVRETDPLRKAFAARSLIDQNIPLGTEEILIEPTGLPGRPAKPELVPHTTIAQRSLATPEGRAAMIHSIAHIEFNAINLAMDITWRFAGMPDQFYQDWLRIASEEALHFTLLRDHLVSFGFDYGDFPAHNALWEMAEKTKADLLARISLVPRTLEARGLDATPAVKRRLIGAGDNAVGKILDIILRDEIGHVAVGNRWYQWLCARRNLPPAATFKALSERYGQSLPRAPFNLEARLAAGFSSDELDDWAEPRPDSRVV
jgi:uncharacterized ferritin-like protein (DUF455 family)